MSKPKAQLPTPNFPVKFVHLRYHFLELVSEENKDGVFNKGGATIAYQLDDKTKEVFFSIALCCLRENFARKIGRAISSGRLAAGAYWKVSLDNFSMSEIFKEVIKPKLYAQAQKNYDKIVADGDVEDEVVDNVLY